MLHVAEPGGLRGGDHVGRMHGVVRPDGRRDDRDHGRPAAGLQPGARREQLLGPVRPGRVPGARVPQGDQAGGPRRQAPQLAGPGDRDVPYAVRAGHPGQGRVVVEVDDRLPGAGGQADEQPSHAG